MNTQQILHEKDCLAEQIKTLRAELNQWKSVFGHLGTADECGNEWIRIQNENLILKDLCKRAFRAVNDDDFPILREELDYFAGCE